MTKENYTKMWNKWLIDIGKSETQLAKELGVQQQGLNRKNREATIRYIDLSEIVEKYGYSIKIHKKP